MKFNLAFFPVVHSVNGAKRLLTQDSFVMGKDKETMKFYILKVIYDPNNDRAEEIYLELLNKK